MRKFNDFFEKKGMLYLNDISFKLLTLETSPSKAMRVSEDNVTTEIINDNTQLRVIFTRVISYSPESMYNLSVSFGAVYTFKNSKPEIEDLSKINFKEMLKENKNTLFLNIITRTSLLISQITSSSGARPLVSPPFYIEIIQNV